MAAQNTRSKTKEDKPDRSKGVTKKPKDDKAEKARKTLENANQKFEAGDNEQQQAIAAQMKKPESKGAQAMDTSGDDDDADSDNRHKAASAVEAGDSDGLFVEKKKSATNNAAQSEDEDTEDEDTDDEEPGHVRGFNKKSSRKDEDLMDVFTGRLGCWYGCYRVGPKHSATFVWEKLENGQEQLAMLEKAERYCPSLIQSRDKRARPGNVALILGHVVENNLAPRDWGQDKNGNLNVPWMRVLVRWNDKEKGPTSWERRGDVKRYMFAQLPSRSNWVAKKAIHDGGKVVVAKGNAVHPGDYDLFRAAAHFQKQYDQYKAGERNFDDENRERTPAPVSSKDSKPETNAEPE